MYIETPDAFKKTLQCPEIGKFIADFKYWNGIALPIMNSMSGPYISLQGELVQALDKKIGEVVLDYGSGVGSIAALIIRSNSASIEQVIAVDPDFEVLRKVPLTLQQAGFQGKIELINSSSMVPLPLKDEEVDTIISGLGAITYSGFYLTPAGIVKGKDALIACLKECGRVLKKGGFLGFSSLIPDPDFKAIKKQSIWMLLKKLRFGALLTVIKQAGKIERASQFMKECASVGLAHYLTEDQWREILVRCGFRVVEFRKGAYAGQGLVVVAEKQI